MTRRLAVALLLGALLAAGCTSSIVPTKKVDYKTARQTAPLEIPPELPAPSASDRFALPNAPARGAATYSEYQQDRPRAQSTNILQPVEGARIERSGTQRWLVVDASAESVWLVLREFWQEQGFILALEDQGLGIMETDWAENRAKIPQSFLRDMIGKVVDQVYSSPEMDRFKTRIERSTGGGGTEIYITHRGAYEMYVADANVRQSGRTVWQPRAADPDLEAEMLTRLMMRLGTTQETAQASVKNTTVQQPRATLGKVADGGTVLVLKDDFDRAWRRVGLSLDRLGFSVQDRDRAAGMYFVRYLEPPSPNKEEPGLLSRLAFWKKDEQRPNQPADYRVAVVQSDGGSQVTVLGVDGKVNRSDAANRMLAILQEDLR
ncbi:MAG: outer membrane protein assembly factor BamC [Burkholderiales bacterium]|nr:outer membrane protein assembly factor BamC [Burkholderiales bacterium]